MNDETTDLVFLRLKEQNLPFLLSTFLLPLSILLREEKIVTIESSSRKIRSEQNLSQLQKREKKFATLPATLAPRIQPLEPQPPPPLHCVLQPLSPSLLFYNTRPPLSVSLYSPFTVSLLQHFLLILLRRGRWKEALTVLNSFKKLGNRLFFLCIINLTIENQVETF